MKIIAEIAGVHMGDIVYAKKLVDSASACGCTHIKFQLYYADDLCEKDHPDYEIFKSLEFTNEEWNELKAHINSSPLQLLVDVFGPKGVNILDSIKPAGIKIHPGDLSNLYIIDSCLKATSDIYLGIGGRKRIEVYETIKYIQSRSPSSVITIMCGFQLFPTSEEEHSLSEIRWFYEKYSNCEIGVADHIDPDQPSALTYSYASLGAGATVFEKHFRLDGNEKREDDESAIKPIQMKEMVNHINALYKTINVFPSWSQSRQTYREKSVKAVQKDSSSRMYKFIRLKHSTNPAHLSALNKNNYDLGFLSDNELITNYSLNPSIGILVNARLDSKRFPRKALAPIAGYPSFLFLLKRLSSLPYQIVFCTTDKPEDNQLCEIASQNGFAVYRGSTLNVADRLCSAAERYGFDHIVRVTGDDILRDISIIPEIVDDHLKTNADFSTIEGLIYGLSSEVLSVRSLSAIAKLSIEPNNTEYLTYYYQDNSAFVVNKKHLKSSNLPGFSLSLDSPEDLEMIKYIVEFHGSKEITNHSILAMSNLHPLADSKTSLNKINPSSFTVTF